VRVLYHRDGKTATVSLVRRGSALSLATNGKPDASLNVTGEGPPRPDELAQILSAALPLAAHPAPKTAANIGFGSGATTHVLLSSNRLREVDSIEIEPFIVEAARGFLPRNELAYSDPRSRIYFEDAKTFFSLHNKRYDIIVSEPSNPWVSGTASLFTDEFYARVRRHLNEGGLFAQWVQMYEINAALVASILKALGRHFPDYAIYAATDFDFLILARRGGRPEPAAGRLFGEPRLARELERVSIRTAGDLDAHLLGTAAGLRPYLEAIAVPPNSDYFPLLEFRAPKARFMNESVGLALELAVAPVPALEMLSSTPHSGAAATPGARTWLLKAQRRETARALLAYLLADTRDTAPPDGLAAEARLARLLLIECARPDVLERASDALFPLVSLAVPVLRAEELRPLWQRIRGAPCHGRLAPRERDWIELFAAVSERDSGTMSRLAESLLESGRPFDAGRADYLLAAAITARLAQGSKEAARRLWARYADVSSNPQSLQLQFLAGHLHPQ
jgi:hypothetical protein